MKTLVDFDGATPFAIPVIGDPDGKRVHEGMLIEGPQGWGEFSPPDGCGDRVASRWLMAAIEAGTVGWPDPVRGRVAVAVAVPAVDPDEAHRIVADARCGSADIEVAGHAGSLDNDIARTEAVRDALGPNGSVRCRAGGRWDVGTAVAAIPLLANAAGALEYVEQPCPAIDDLHAVRRLVDVAIAVHVTDDRMIRYEEGPPGSSLAEAADVAVFTVGPLGGVRRTLRLAEVCGLPAVVSSTLQTSVGLASALAVAGALPELNSACAIATPSTLRGDPVSAGRSLVPIDGYLPVAPMPPAPNRELLDQFAIADSSRVAWWRDRLKAAQAYI